MENVWHRVKETLKERIPAHMFQRWIEPIQFLKPAGENIVLVCPNHFLKKRIIENFGILIRSELCQAANSKLNFILEVPVKAENSQHAGAEPLSCERQKPRQLPLPNMGNRPKYGRVLRRDFTFDRFVVGKNCDFAYMAALSLASQKKPSQNALFLLSPAGMGKSHLSQAAGHQILASYPGQQVFYVTAEDFTNEMVEAYKKNAIDSFKSKYRRFCDVLLMEDIHMLSGKTRTQEELALTLDYLYDSGKKIIYSSCMPLGEIPKLSEQLKSRISLSLVSEIDAPDFKTRVKILQNKAREKAMAIPVEVIEYLAGELTQSVRQLESGLTGVIMKSSLMGHPIDLSLAESVAKNIVLKHYKITVEDIKKTVCNEFGISIKDMVSKSRKQSIVRPRQIAIFLARRHTDHPIEAIGRSFNRYHATVIHSINVVQKEMKLKSDVSRQVDLIEKKLNAPKN